MKPSENELITHIKESLIGHKEPYVPGAWENFNKEEKKKNGLVFWTRRLSGTAATLLIGISLFLFISRTSNKVPGQITKAKPGQVSKLPVTIEEEADITGNRMLNENEDVSARNNRNTSIANNDAVVYQRQNNKGTENYLVPSLKALGGIPDQTPVTSQSDDTSQIPVVVTPKADEVITEVAPQVIVKISNDNKRTTFQEFLNNDTKINEASKEANSSAKKENKWEAGVIVASSFGNTKKINMGYGISMGYIISNKISLNSGLSYNQMASSRSVKAPLTMASGSKKLVSVEAKFTGIDIPMEIKYHLSKNIYTKAGVSAFAILNQKHNNNFVEGKLVERPVNTSAGVQELKTFVVIEKTTEEAQESEIKEDNYLGFYNFSFGYKQKISKSKAVSIEPFMKLPIKDVTKETLHLFETGVRLKFDF